MIKTPYCVLANAGHLPGNFTCINAFYETQVLLPDFKDRTRLEEAFSNFHEVLNCLLQNMESSKCYFFAFGLLILFE